MNKICGTRQQFDAAVKARPPEYLRDVGPCIVMHTATEVCMDSDHPSFIAAMMKYRGIVSTTAGELPAGPKGATTPEQWGPPMWDRWHGDNDIEPGFVEQFVKDIPAGFCNCRAHFKAIVAANPPKFFALDGDERRAALRRWRFDIHNAVRRSLNQAELSFEDAAKQRGWT